MQLFSRPSLGAETAPPWLRNAPRLHTHKPLALRCALALAVAAASRLQCCAAAVAHYRRDKRKKVKGKKPGAGADKTDKKTEKNEEKKTRRLERAAQVRGWAGPARVRWLPPAGQQQAPPSPSPPPSMPSTPLPCVPQGGEDDIDTLLAAFKLKDEKQHKVEVHEDCASPSPRVYASFTPIPSQARRHWGAAVVLGCDGAALHAMPPWPAHPSGIHPSRPSCILPAPCRRRTK